MFYVKDPTTKRLTEYKTYPEVVRHLEGTIQRLKKMTRKQFMDEMVALGHGYDDNGAVQFVKLMAEAVEMGVIRKNPNRTVRCDITNIASFSKPEYGD